MDRKGFIKKTGIIALGAVIPLRMREQVYAGNHIEKSEETLSLAGNWQFRLDQDKVGIQEQWFKKDLITQTLLPASTDKAGIGRRTIGVACGHLSREWRYIGVCWFQREIRIPEDWSQKHIVLFLERCLWETQVWINEKKIGSFDSLSVPHKYELGSLSPGRYTLTIRVDNSPIVTIGDYGHAYTEHTQSKWNGLVGNLLLKATDPIYLSDVQVYPDVEKKQARVQVHINNTTVSQQSGRIRLQAISVNTGRKQALPPVRMPFTVTESEVIEVNYSMGEIPLLWDEFDPDLYTMNVELESGSTYSDIHTVDFGMRHLGTKNRQVTINNQPITLRGNLECCIFPETGHPPMDVESWQRLMKISKSHGLNHLRFHSWCPPEAAFIAADKEGLYLQVETPLWYDYWMSERRLLTCSFAENDQLQNPKPFGEDSEVVVFIQNELNRIIKAYGNHPSFCMLCIGNEIGGDYDLMNRMIGKAKKRDPRHLYACSTAREYVSEDDYYVTHQTEGGPVRGIKSDGTATSFEKGRNAVDVPVISHEIGQYVVHPDFTEIPKYSGTLKPQNLKYFREKIRQNGLLDQVTDFKKASGKFAWQLYKEEIEAALRTPLAGFQLLQLQDFPGQGEALVGLLDAFWDSKGIMDSAKFRQFCSPTVLLLEIDKFVWTTDEKLKADVMVHHAGRNPLKNINLEWMLHDEYRNNLQSGHFNYTGITTEQVTWLGTIEIDLNFISKAKKLTLTVKIANKGSKNNWNIWVYPSSVATAAIDDIVIAENFNNEVSTALKLGQKVLLLPAHKRETENRQQTRFTPVFWSYKMFEDQPGCLGILCDPQHPALADFPTDFHCDWQWKELMNGGQSFIINELPEDLMPIVQVVDDFHRGNKLGAVLEVKVGKGKLMICSLDVLSNLNERPVANQLRYSLLNYIVSDQFDPNIELNFSQIDRLLT